MCEYDDIFSVLKYDILSKAPNSKFDSFSCEMSKCSNVSDAPINVPFVIDLIGFPATDRDFNKRNECIRIGIAVKLL